MSRRVFNLAAKSAVLIKTKGLKRVELLEIFGLHAERDVCIVYRSREMLIALKCGKWSETGANRKSVLSLQRKWP